MPISQSAPRTFNARFAPLIFGSKTFSDDALSFPIFGLASVPYIQITTSGTIPAAPNLSLNRRSRREFDSPSRTLSGVRSRAKLAAVTGARFGRGKISALPLNREHT